MNDVRRPVDACPPSFASRLWYDALYVASRCAFTLAFSYRCEGSENMPKDGPVLVVANHQSFLDPPLIGVATYPRHLVYLARKTLFRNRYFAGLIRSLNAVPIDQESVGKEGLKTVLDQLQLGRAVLIFPEGSRTGDGQMHEFRPGVQLLIKRAGAPIVPVGVAGAYDAWPIWRKYPIPAPLFLPRGAGSIAVSVGEPLSAERFKSLSREDSLRTLYEKVVACQRRAEKLRRRA
jgi:1-acyl-sn-glycerol-3-phosphate acyltransferase